MEDYRLGGWDRLFDLMISCYACLIISCLSCMMNRACTNLSAPLDPFFQLPSVRLVNTCRLLLKRDLGMCGGSLGGFTRPAQRHLGIARACSLPLHPQARLDQPLLYNSGLTECCFTTDLASLKTKPSLMLTF